MNMNDRLIIRNNRNKLNSLINLTELVPFLLSRRVFNQKMIDDIMFAEDDSKRKERLLIDICKRGPEAFDKLVEALLDTGHDAAVKILKPAFKLKRTGSKPHRNAPKPANGERSNNHIEEQVMDNKLKVLPSYNRVVSEDAIYLMEDEPRGYCLIINNVEFEGYPEKTRFGSDADAKRLDEVFQELGFQVILRRNLNSFEMMKTCDNLVKKINEYYIQRAKRMNALALIILSHGQENTVYGSNNLPVDIFELIEKFNNDGCKGLIGSPKMFFIQACRGDKVDFGVNIKTEQQLLGDCVVKSEATSDAQPFGMIDFMTHSIVVPYAKRASWQDVIISYPTVYGYVAMRNPEMGSWYCSHLVDALINYSCSHRLIDILCKVENGVRKMQTSGGDKQSTCIELIGWNKRLYFNPGFYKGL